MPNIEIHGLSKEAAMSLKNEIFTLFQSEPYAEEMVVTIYPTIVRDVHNKNQPFIRLVNSCDIHTQEIIKKFQRVFNIDIEHLELKGFIAKKT